MLNSICSTRFVRYIETVRSWEGPLWEVLLYIFCMHTVCIILSQQLRSWKNTYYHMGVDTILELGGAELEVGRKCARAQIFNHTHLYVNTSTYSAYNGYNNRILLLSWLAIVMVSGMLLLISIIMILINKF